MKKTGLKVITGLTLTIAMILSCGGFLVADVDPLPSEIVINESNFPDAVFRNYIKTKIDTDGNDSLSSSEIEATTEIDVNGQFYTEKISDLAGIQFFTALRRLYCYDNAITSLDLSNNPNLELLYCSHNNLTSLNIANHPLLWSMGIQNNPNLTQVDITGCQRLIDTFYNATPEVYENRITLNYNVDGECVGYMVYDNGLGFIAPQTPPVQSPTFVGHALQLTGTIGLQFFVQLPAGADRNAYNMTFTNAHNHISESETFSLQPTDKVGTPDTYMVQINVSSIMLAEEFTPTLHCGELAWTDDAYSVEDYISWGITNLPSSSKAMKVVRALADYGYYAQPYLSSVNGWLNNGSVYALMTVRFTDGYVYDDIIDIHEDLYRIIINNPAGSGISQVHYSLRFGDTVSLRVFLTPSSELIDGDLVTVTGGYSGASVDKTQTGDQYNRLAVTITGIPASYLFETYTIAYNGATIDVSPMSYVYGMLTSSAASSRNDACDLVSAFYYYCVACSQGLD